jgi:hypothetical protein
VKAVFLPIHYAPVPEGGTNQLIPITTTIIKKHILPDHKQKSFVIWIVNSAMHEDTIKSFSTHQPPRQVPQIRLAATQFGIVPTSALVAGTKNCLDSSHIAIDQN